MIKTTCKNCPQKVRKYCRYKSISKNSVACDRAYIQDFHKNKSMFQQIKLIFNRDKQIKTKKVQKGD